jgi:hypothetical protein
MQGGYDMMIRKLGLPAAMALCAILLASCSNFFTTSWGKNWARDPDKIEVSAKNVKNLLKESKGDTKASKGILDKIAKELKGNPNPDPTLQVAAITAANQAAGLSELVLENIGTVLNAEDGDEDTFKDLLKEVQDTAKNNDLPGIKTGIVDSLGGAVTTNGNKPVFKDNLVKDVPDAELAQLALVLVLAESEASGKDFDTYVSDWGDTKNLNSATSLSESETIIAAIANELASRPGDLGSMISDLLGSSN